MVSKSGDDAGEASPYNLTVCQDRLPFWAECGEEVFHHVRAGDIA